MSHQSSLELHDIANFIGSRAPPEPRAAPHPCTLSLHHPARQTLVLLDALLNRPRPQGSLPGDIHAAFAALSWNDLRHIRYRHVPPLLTLTRTMPTAMHDCTKRFIHHVLCSPCGPLKRLLSATEIACVTPETDGTTMPGGPSDKGFRDPTERGRTLKRRRAKPRALKKVPDIALTHQPDLAPFLPRDSDDSSSGGDDSDSEPDAPHLPQPDPLSDEEEEQHAGGVARPAPQPQPQELPSTHACPHIVFEVGYSQRYRDLLADARDWLLSTQGHIKLVILISIKYATVPASDLPAPAPASGARSSSPIPSSPEGPARMATHHAAANDVDRDPSIVDTFINPMNAFLEVWEYKESADGNGNGVTCRRGPRIHLVKQNIPAEHIRVPLRRSDFGLNTTSADGVEPHKIVKTNWATLATFMLMSRKKDAFERRIQVESGRQAAKRRAVGDVRGLYIPPSEDDDGIAAVGDDEEEED
ncbi:hypothetical protein DFH27DRAFT_656706 [Peziza echinospora]|nr:hypothetical protein DFH27DRAFT_656706 [Peziza echinospora]